MAQQDFPYRRDIRPVVPEGLGEHVDREFGKIENAIFNLKSSANSAAALWTLSIDAEGGTASTPSSNYLLRLDFGGSGAA